MMLGRWALRNYLSSATQTIKPAKSEACFCSKTFALHVNKIWTKHLNKTMASQKSKEKICELKTKICE